MNLSVAIIFCVLLAEFAQAWPPYHHHTFNHPGIFPHRRHFSHHNRPLLHHHKKHNEHVKSAMPVGMEITNRAAIANTDASINENTKHIATAAPSGASTGKAAASVAGTPTKASSTNGNTKTLTTAAKAMSNGASSGKAVASVTVTPTKANPVSNGPSNGKAITAIAGTTTKASPTSGSSKPLTTTAKTVSNAPSNGKVITPVPGTTTKASATSGSSKPLTTAAKTVSNAPSNAKVITPIPGTTTKASATAANAPNKSSETTASPAPAQAIFAALSLAPGVTSDTIPFYTVNAKSTAALNAAAAIGAAPTLSNVITQEPTSKPSKTTIEAGFAGPTQAVVTRGIPSVNQNGNGNMATTMEVKTTVTTSNSQSKSKAFQWH